MSEGSIQIRFRLELCSGHCWGVYDDHVPHKLLGGVGW